MNGSWAANEGRPTTVLVFEYVTGGGLVGRDLPPSWAAEGTAMRRAIAADFAAVPGVRVVMTVDARLPPEQNSRVVVLRIGDRDEEWFARLVSQADRTILIAPETDGILANSTQIVKDAGGKSLGSSPRAIGIVGDKFRLAHHFRCHEIPSPPVRTLSTGMGDPPAEWDGMIIIKPRMGAGSIDTIVVKDRECPSWIPFDGSFVAQPYLPGRPMSASFLVDAEARSFLLAVGRQRIEIDAEGKLSYQGGTLFPLSADCPDEVAASIASVTNDDPEPSLRGFVGVDFLLDDQGEATILEINPRPTTSYVGLARLFPPGTIAGAWLAADAGPLASTDWPDRLRLNPDSGPIAFDADGTILPRPRDDDQ